jgi:tetratricopeptide (TPR) repeat protein/cold shock CspA family protein
MPDVDGMLADVRALAHRGDHQTIVSRYGSLDDTPADETWNSTELLYEIGRAFGMLGHEEKVERYLLRCAELSPRRAAVFHCAIGWYFQRKKKWSKALRWYDRALQSFPTYHLCLFRRGYCLEKLHRPREALEAFTAASHIWDEAGPDQRARGRGVQVQVLFHLSRVQRDLGSFEDARATLDLCSDLDLHCDPPAIRPEHLLACRGELHLRTDDFGAALDLFRQARDLDPESSYVWERIGRVHELRGDVEAAQQAFEHAASLPRGAFGHLALGRLHAHVTRDLPTAVRSLRAALVAAAGVEPLVRVELARIHLAHRRPRAAIQQLEHALACRRDGGFTEALRLAAEVAETLGRFQDAASMLRDLAKTAPDGDALLARAEILARVEPPARSEPEDAPLPPSLRLLETDDLLARGREHVDGVVDRFFREKGFGFIRYGDGRSIFFHVTQCADDAGDLEAGVRVSFIVGHNPKKGKPQAESVQRAD